MSTGEKFSESQKPKKDTATSESTKSSEALAEKASPKTANSQGQKLVEPPPFLLEDLYPDAEGIFSPSPSLTQVKNEALVVLDTNVLLIPYGVSGESLAQIKLTYKKLVTESRLRIPVRVAREFAKNRASKISSLFQFISQRRQPSFKQENRPMFDGLDGFNALKSLENELETNMNKYRIAIKEALDDIKSWEWNDPVTLLYKELSFAEFMIDTKKNRDEIQKDHIERFNNGIPPGYKDGSKPDGGIGDFLIWLSILDLGASSKKHVIFVSGEEKADWWLRSEGQTIFPRFELVDEYRRASSGASFHIIKLSTLLELFDATSETVEEIRAEEHTSLNATVTLRNDPKHPTESSRIAALLAEARLQEQTALRTLASLPPEAGNDPLSLPLSR